MLTRLLANPIISVAAGLAAVKVVQSSMFVIALLTHFRNALVQGADAILRGINLLSVRYNSFLK